MNPVFSFSPAQEVRTTESSSLLYIFSAQGYCADDFLTFTIKKTYTQCAKAFTQVGWRRVIYSWPINAGNLLFIISINNIFFYFVKSK